MYLAILSIPLCVCIEMSWILFFMSTLEFYKFIFGNCVCYSLRETHIHSQKKGVIVLKSSSFLVWYSVFGIQLWYSVLWLRVLIWWVISFRVASLCGHILAFLYSFLSLIFLLWNFLLLFQSKSSLSMGRKVAFQTLC